MAPFGKALIIMDLVAVGVGVMLWMLGDAPVIGRLPGDVYIRRGNFTFYFPVVTCIVISIVSSLLFSLMRR